MQIEFILYSASLLRQFGNMVKTVLSLMFMDPCIIVYRNSQQDATAYQNLLFHVYMKLHMFRATHRPSSGAQNCTTSLWFCIRERLLHVEVASNNLNIQQPFTYAKPDAANAVLSS